MVHDSVERYLSSGAVRHIPEGVVAIVLADDPNGARATCEHLVELGAVAILVIGQASDPALTNERAITGISDDTSGDASRARAINTLIDSLAGRWLLWVHAGEFFYFPFCETRTIADLTAFLDSERRRLLYTYAFDLYANALPAPGEDPRDRELFLDRLGHYAFPSDDGGLDVYGGLAWRFEEHLGGAEHHIGRPALFRARKGEHLGIDLRFTALEYGSVACPWHNNPTGAIVTLRNARRLFGQPGFGAVRSKLIWRGSTRFEWNSRQLLELGLIETGQWF